MCCGRILSAPTTAGGRAADGSTARRSLQLVYPNRFLSGGLPGGLRVSTYACHVRSVIVRLHCRPRRVLRFLSGGLPGGLRVSTYAYHVRSVIVRRRCRPGRVLRFLSGGLPGGLRASTYAYHTRSVIVRRRCRPGRVLRFLSGGLPGGLGHQRMRTMSVALLSGGTAAKRGQASA